TDSANTILCSPLCGLGFQRAMPHSFPTGGHLQKLWGGRPRPQPAPGRPVLVLQMLDTSTEQRDEGVPRRPGVCPTRHSQNPRTGRVTVSDYAASPYESPSISASAPAQPADPPSPHDAAPRAAACEN